MNISYEVNKIIYDALKDKISYEDIKPNKCVIKDLGAESLEVMEIFLSLADKFNINWERKDIIAFECINDIYTFIEKKMTNLNINVS
jgi:acyl carrier protein